MALATFDGGCQPSNGIGNPLWASWPPESIVYLRDRNILKLPTQETPLCFGAKGAEVIFLS